MSSQLNHVFDGRFELVVDIPDFVSYLHYDNRRPVISGLAIRALDKQVHADLELQVRLVSATTDYSETLKIGIPEIGPASLELEGELKLLPRLFSAIESNQSAEFEFELLEGEKSLGLKTVSTELYPLNHWKLGGRILNDMLLLSAFSQPSDPAIKRILTKAGEIKGTYKDADGDKYSPNTRGYQGKPDEVLAEAKAVYEALQSFDIRYSNPLPNFNANGQPIRTPSEILDTKAATCLDSALLIASALEAINLHPVIFTVPQHAFVGVWLVEDLLPAPVKYLNDVTGLVKDRMVIFETTTVCKSENPVSFEDACTMDLKWLDQSFAHEYDAFIPRLVIDVVAARSREYGIHPLPTVKANSDGTVTVISTELPKVEFNFTGTTEAPRLSLRDDNSPARVKIWKTSLLDSSFNNPLLNRDRRRGSILQLAIPNGKLGDIEDLLQSDRAKVSLQPFWKPVDGGFAAYRQQTKFEKLPEEWNEIANERMVRNKALSYILTTQVPTSVLRKLANASMASIQETGVNNLYMTFGSLTWDKDPESPAAGQVTSPLFLLPVSLKNLGRDNFELSLDDSGEPAPNETLAIALAKVGVNVPLLSNPETDAAGFDIPGLLNHVREQVNVVSKKTSWVVNEDAFLGTFDFSNFHMWKDLHDNWAELAKAPLVKHLIETDGTKPYVDANAAEAEITDAQLDDEMSRLPIESDAAQVKAVLQSLSGESFIIQGPPGTGKSQTITNLLARNLQEGKRILFMSEKAAALGVVKSRLDEIGLGDYVLDLHDKGTKPANIRNQLIASLDASHDVDKTGLESANSEYDIALRVLSKYPDRLHHVNEKYQESVYSARMRSLELTGSESLALTRKFVNETGRSEFEKLEIDFRELPAIGENAKTLTTNEWSLSRALKESLNLETKDRIKGLLRQINQTVKEINSIPALQPFLARATSAAELEAFGALATSNAPSASELAIARSAEGRILHKQFKAQIAKLSTDAKSVPYYSPKLSSLNVAEMQLRLVEASNGGLFKGKKFKTASEFLNPHLAISSDKDTVASAFASVQPIIDLARKANELKSGLAGLGDLSGLDMFDLVACDALLLKMTELEMFLEKLDPTTNPNAELLLEALNAGVGPSLTKLSELGKGLAELFKLLQVTEESLNVWRGTETIGSKLVSAVPAWIESAEDGEFRALTRWSDVITILQPMIILDQTEAVTQLLSGAISYNDAPQALQRSYFKLLFEKLVDEQEIANFEGRSHDSKISQLGDALKKLREYNRGQIASDVLGTRKFDSSSNAGVTGALRAELTKQRRQLPIRKLMKQYWQTITQITPVVAASPDSVARFLDINVAKFDLVVFDEASQIRVAAAIGALGRATQAIVVGDTEQMPPTQLFKGAGDGTPEDLVDEDDLFNLNDQESILSMAGVSQIPSTMLTWHYRSNDELLIAFSNKYIYEGKLSSFPSPRIGEGKKEDRKLSLRVDKTNLYVQSTKGGATAAADDADELAGKGGTNLDEAKRVVAEIQARVKKAGTKGVSLGVITMNEQQRDIIEKLLDALDDDKIRRLRNPEIPGNEKDYLFVRALERVQGDERDVILFSIGFAPTQPGGKLSMSFGPLTRGRSERRLNVAVTRARKEMVVFSSFEPEQMTINETSSKGLKLLQKFLKLAQGDPENGDSGAISVASTTMKTLKDRHRSDVANSLRELGYEVRENLGLSNFRVDIAIADPRNVSKCILGIMLDGEGWKSRNSTSDRDVLPTVVLRNNMKWPGIERIWLPMWLRDRDGELQRIKLAIDTALAAEELRAEEANAPILGDAPTQELNLGSLDGLIDIGDLLATAGDPIPGLAAPEAKAPKTAGLGVSLDEIEHYRMLRDDVMVPDKKYIDYLDHPEIRKLLLSLIEQLTNTEGPVSEKRATVFVAKCFGYSTVQEAKRNYILQNISKTVHKRDGEGFLFPKGTDPNSFDKWGKQYPGVGRALAEISLSEISNAMATICAKTAGMESAELAKQTSLAFGFSKLTNLADARMVAAEKFGIKRGLLVDHDGIIMKANA